MTELPVVYLCCSTRAVGGLYVDKDKAPMTATEVRDECPLGLQRKYHDRCPCAQVRKVGETYTGSVCATVCTYPALMNGEEIRNPDGLAAYVRRQAGG